MKILRVAGKLIKWYLIADVLALAVVGTAEVLDEQRRNPLENGEIRDARVMDNAIEKIMNWWNR